jgi:hypothetical protein
MAAYTTIDNPELYFQTKIYTGDGTTSNAQTFDGSEDMQANMIWFKRRSGSANHFLYDSVRGANRSLVPNDTDAEATSGEQTTYLASFDSDGFTLGDDVNNINASNETYVAWAWKESATAGFDIVSYTGNATARTISHSLSAVPDWILCKRLSNTADWTTSTTDVNWENSFFLNQTNAAGDAPTTWNDTDPTSSVFTLGTTSLVNADGDNFIAYLWKNIQGFSKIGKYTGNGNANGPFVYTGFRPAFIMFKPNTSADWTICDTKRNTFNPVADLTLNANLATGDHDGGMDFDILSNGFKVRNVNTDNNHSGTVFYMAFAEQPFANSNGAPANAR